MKKIIIGAIVIIAIGLFIGFNIAKNQQRTVSTVELKTVQLAEKEIRSTVMTPGTLTFSEEQYVFFEENKGSIKNIEVKEGDKVEPGSALLTYENKELQLEKEQQALAIESSQLKIEQLREQLNEKKDGSSDEPELTSANRNQLEMELKAAELEKKQAELNRQKVQDQIDDLTIYSELKGTIISIHHEATTANKSDIQQPVIHIGNEKKMVVRGVLSEYDTLKVKKKQKVKITSDVIRGKSWEGVVKQVGLVPDNPSTENTSAEQTVQYPVEIEIKGKKPEGKPGFKMIMEIETDKRKALTLPDLAVKKEDDHHYVYVIQKNKLKKIQVELGETTGNQLEVKKGLTTTDQIIANPSEDMHDGMEVNAQ
ncbi:efflux RND transporter periplasmic adaptor subunit [Bacillus sp. NPDC077027]|uniref:efflux RND transporter periplasmic adaptor subunit n=1 Tax=Bacillus sp. NPDC077027 TaxID=3390548 RepID=UPI003D03997D